SSAAERGRVSQVERREVARPLLVRGFILPSKGSGRIRSNLIFQSRGRKSFEPAPFDFKFLGRIEQQIAKRSREQTGFHFEAGNLRHRLPISGQLWAVTLAKDFDIA